jgi:hypothetical protein
MKKEVADAWVEALRSGDYRQAKGMLREGDNFCCLGVLCDISKQGEFRDSPVGQTYFDGVDVRLASIPPLVMEWAGMKSEGGAFLPRISLGGKTADRLWKLNDQLEWSFEKIADFIETNWEKL